MKIFILDPSPLARNQLKEILREEGIDIQGESDNPEQGLKLLQDIPIDLFFLEILFPKQNGLHFITPFMKRRPKSKIVVSSYLNSEFIRSKAFQMGAAGFIEKPFSKKNVMESVDIISKLIKEE